MNLISEFVVKRFIPAVMGSFFALFLYFEVADDASAQTYIYDAVCENSHSKQGKKDEDLTKKSGDPIKCDAVVFALLKNGHVLFQVTEKKSGFTLGFAGSKLGYDSNPKFATLPLERMYLPYAPNPLKPEPVNGEGVCFFDMLDKRDISALKSAGCTAKIETGSKHVVYSIHVSVTGGGEPIPFP